jgi:two-component system chemotaxis response regulator CheB
MGTTARLVRQPIRVLIIDRSSAWRRVLAGLLSQSEELRVLAITDPENALPVMHQHRPDVLIWGIEPSDTPSLAPLRSVQYLHIPVIAVMTAVEPHQVNALRRQGVVDIFLKPANFLSADLNALRKELTAKIRAAADSRLGTAGPETAPGVPARPATQSLTARSRPTTQTLARPRPPTAHLLHPTDPIVVAIAASTGGPQSLDRVISALPADLPACVLIVQHMPPGFTASFAERLNRKGQFPVKEAAEGDPVHAGRAYVAAGGFHLVVKRSFPGGPLFLHLDDSPPVNGLRPAANVLFHSLVEQEVERIVAVVMTGMGTDGAEGIQAIKAQGGWVIAQDEETCVIYGMPKAAAATGCVDRIVPLSSIPEEIVKAVQTMRLRERLP